MKKVFFLSLLLLICLPLQAMGMIYYVSISGDDANSGTSPSAPWRSLFKLNRTYFAAGDSILFKRGDIWIGADAAPIVPATSGAAGSPITWGAYGTGRNPVLTAASNRNSSSDWTSEGNNIWSTGGVTLIEGELFPNPDFSLDATGWYSQCSGAGASCSYAGRAAPEGGQDVNPAAYKVAVIDHGAYGSDVQLYTASGFPLSFTQGRYYQITFRAKSTAPFTIPALTLRSHNDGSDITSGMFVRELRVGTDWTTCTFIFRADRTTTTGGFNMFLGGDTGVPNGATLYLGSFSCREIKDRDFFGMYYSANLIFNFSSGAPVTGKLVQSGALSSQGQWHQSYVDRKVRLYSASNPAEYYRGDILIVNGAPRSGFWVGGKSYHTVQNLDFFAMPSAWYGFDFTDDTIEYCNAYYTGGDLQIDIYDYNWGRGSVIARKGESVGATGNVTNWTVRYNNFRQSYDCNVTWQNSDSGKKADGIWVYYNILGQAHYNIEFWWRGPQSSMSNIHIYNNTMYDAGGEWSADQRPDEPVQTQDAHIKCWDSPANGANIDIRNNLMVGGVSEILYFSVWSQWASVLSMDHNLYYGKPASFARVSGSSYASLADWKSMSGKDVSSLWADPFPASRVTLDFHLGPASPARAAGVNVGLTTDIAGNPVDVNTPAIGAYEYVPTGTDGGALSSSGGGCSIGARQNAPTACADTVIVSLPLVLIILMRRRR